MIVAKADENTHYIALHYTLTLLYFTLHYITFLGGLGVPSLPHDAHLNPSRMLFWPTATIPGRHPLDLLASWGMYSGVATVKLSGVSNEKALPKSMNRT